MSKAQVLSELKRSIIEDICDEYLKLNFDFGLDGEGSEQREVAKGIFMAGAATYFDITGGLAASKLPDSEVTRLVKENSMNAVKQSHGKLIRLSVEEMQMPTPSEAMH